MGNLYKSPDQSNSRQTLVFYFYFSFTIVHKKAQTFFSCLFVWNKNINNKFCNTSLLYATTQPYLGLSVRVYAIRNCNNIHLK